MRSPAQMCRINSSQAIHKKHETFTTPFFTNRKKHFKKFLCFHRRVRKKSNILVVNIF